MREQCPEDVIDPGSITVKPMKVLNNIMHPIVHAIVNKQLLSIC